MAKTSIVLTNTIALAVSQTPSCSIFFERERDREKGTFKVKSLGSYYLSRPQSHPHQHTQGRRDVVDRKKARKNETPMMFFRL